MKQSSVSQLNAPHQCVRISNGACEHRENKMRLILSFALVVASTAFGPSAGAQSLEDNEHYEAFKSWAIGTQQPDPVPE